MDTFARPWLLLVLPAAAAAIVLAERATRSRRGRAARVALRGLVALAATLAAAGLRLPGGRARPACVFAVDVSRSMGDPATERPDLADALLDTFDRFPPRTPRAVVAFASDAHVALGFTQSEDSLTLDGPGMPRPLGTNIAGGLSAAMGLVPSGAPACIAMVSDGRATAGDVLASALECRSRGIPVFALAPAAVDLPDLRVEALSAPTVVEEGRPVPLTATIAGTRSGKVEVVLRRMPGGNELGRAGVRVVAGGRAHAAFEDSPPSPGVVRYEAEVLALGPSAAEGDAFPENDRAEAAVMVSGVPAVLVVSKGGAVADLLEEAKGRFRIARKSPEAVAPSADALAGYACVVLEGLSRDDVTPALESALVTYVRRGGGILATGGPSAFGAGGWRDGEALPAALPVAMSPGPIAKTLLVIIVDASGSMAFRGSPGRSKIEDAREAIATVLQAPELGAEDELALVAFRDEARVLLEPVTMASRDEILDKLQDLKAEGKTSLAAPLEAGLEVLGRSDAKRRIALMLSDGESTVRHTTDELVKIAGRFKSQGWALHILGTNPAERHMKLLRLLARAGGGQSRFESDYAKLKETVGDMIEKAAGTYVLPGLVSVTPVARDDPVLAGLDAFPRLGGLVRTKLAPRAREVLTSGGGEPVLAVRPFGAGRTAAFMSTFGEPWTGEFGRWRRRLRFLSQLLREITPPPPEKGFAIRPRASDRDETVLDITARDTGGAPRDLLALRVELWGATGGDGPERVDAEQVGLGLYRARVPEALGWRRSRTLFARLLMVRDGVEREVLRAPVTLPVPAEVLRTGVDRGALSDIARASGGRLLAGAEELPPTIESLDRRESSDATPYAAAAALVMVVLELAWRIIAGSGVRGGRQ